MKSTVFIALAASALAAFASDDHPTGNLPPVLRPLEPADSSVFCLPSPPPVTPKFRLVPVSGRVSEPSPLISKLTPAPLPPLPVVVAPVALPAAPVSAPLPVMKGTPALPALATVVEPAKPALPPEAAQEMAFYCQKRIGQWTEADARKLLGAPVRSRAAFDEREKANGKIFAFRDPTSRYRELELDFEARTGALRTVFVYPHKMTFQDVRRRWHGEVSAAEAPQGRTFYSYSNRRIDVLVDSQGTVISLGLY